MASRLGHPLALIMLDVDYFKLYNDHYGHVAGDECLRQIAATLQHQAKRPTDFVARYGGEEFVVLLSYTDLAQAVSLAELIRASVEALQLPHELNPLGVVTISLGVGGICPQPGQTAEDLITLADSALYQAKDNGRNCVCVNQTQP